MTEVAATQEATPEVQDTPSVPARDTLDVLSQALLNAAQPKMAELTKIAAKQAAVGNVGKALDDAINASTDEDVVKRRAAMEKANEALIRLQKECEELVKPTLDLPSDEELNEMDLQYKVYASELNSFNAAFQVETSKVYEGLSVFDYLGELPGKRRGAKAGQGTGTIRPRVTSIEFRNTPGTGDYTKAEKNGKSTFSVLSAMIKDATQEVIGAGDFSEAWCSQNGVKVEDWATLSEVSTFIYSLTDGEGKNHQYEVRVTK